MKTELSGQEKNIVKIKVEFEAEEFMQKFNSTFNELSKQVNIPGFRKGHAPRKVIEMRLGRETIYNETLEKMLPDAVEQVIDDYGLDVVNDPAISVESIKEGEPVTCLLTFEVMPQVELPVLEEIEVEKIVPSVTDKHIDDLAQKFRDENTRLEPVERPAGNEDVVSVKFSTYIMGEEGLPSEPQSSNIGLFDESVRLEVREALIGKSVGETTETEFDVEADYQDSRVAGKRVRYSMTVEAVNMRIMPEMDAEFFKKVMTFIDDKSETYTEEAFRESLRNIIVRRMEAESHSHALYNAVAKVTELAVVDVPDAFIDRQSAHMKKREADEAKRRYAKEFSEILAESSITEEQYDQDIRRQAEAMVRRTLVLDAVGKKYEVIVEKEEFEAEVRNRASHLGMDAGELAKILQKNESAMSQILDDVRYSKIRELVLRTVKVKEVENLSEPESSEAASAE